MGVLNTSKSMAGVMGHAFGIRYLCNNSHSCIRYNSSCIRLGWPTKGIEVSRGAFSAFRPRIGKSIMCKPKSKCVRVYGTLCMHGTRGRN